MPLRSIGQGYREKFGSRHTMEDGGEAAAAAGESSVRVSIAEAEQAPKCVRRRVLQRLWARSRVEFSE